MLTRKIITFILIALLPVGQASVYVNQSFAIPKKTSFVSTKLINPSLTGLATGQEAEDINTAVDTATNAVVNNYLTHHEIEERIESAQACEEGIPGACERLSELNELGEARDKEIKPLLDLCRQGNLRVCKRVIVLISKTNDLGYISGIYESESKSGTPYSFNYCPSSDRGGCSYGSWQLASNENRGLFEFMKYLERNQSEEAQYFYNELRKAGGLKGARAGSKEFLTKFKNLTQEDPQFVQFQFESIKRGSGMTALQEEIRSWGGEKIEFDELPRSLREAIFSGAVQFGGGGMKWQLKKVLYRKGNMDESDEKLFSENIQKLQNK